MASIEILDITAPTETPTELLGFSLDAPRQGTESHVFVLQIIGWAVGRDARAVAVEIVYHNRLLRSVPIRGSRPELRDENLGVRKDEECHFHALVGVLGLTPTFELHVQVVLENGTRAPVAVIRARHEPVQPAFEPSLQPIILTCLGRTGTTWLMKMLAAHPQVVVYERYPYESSPAKYWTHMLKVLSDPANLAESSKPDSFHNDLWWVGQNPFHDEDVAQRPGLGRWFGREYIEHLANFCLTSIDEWYMTLAREQGQERPIYFAEKYMWPNYIPVLMRELYPDAKEVFLVRDFRDMVCSILAFDTSRGYAGFGRPNGKTDEEYIRGELRAAAISLGESWKSRGDRAHLMRYEDMVLSSHDTLTELLKYLDLDSSSEIVTEMLRKSSEDTTDLRRHRTSSDPSASIGRWRRERDESFRELCDEVFADVLEEFGYSEAEAIRH